MTNEERKLLIQKWIATNNHKLNVEAIKKFKGPKVEIIKDENKKVVDDMQKKDAIKNVEDEKLKEEQAALEFLGVEKVDNKEKSSADKMKEVREKAKEKLLDNCVIFDTSAISGLYHIIRQDQDEFINIIRGRIKKTTEAIRNSKDTPLGKEQLDSLNTTLKFIALATEVDKFDANTATINEPVDIQKAHKDIVSVRECLGELASACSEIGNTEEVKLFDEVLSTENIVLSTVEKILEEDGINKESMDQILELSKDATAEDVAKIQSLVNEAVGAEPQTGEVQEAINQLNEINDHETITEAVGDVVETTAGVAGTLGAIAAVGEAVAASTAIIGGAAIMAGVMGGALGTAIAVHNIAEFAEQMRPGIDFALESMDFILGIEPPVRVMNNSNDQY